MITDKLRNWKSIGDVDWGIIDSNLIEFGRKSLASLFTGYPNEKYYAVVARIGQNWDFTLSANTPAGWDAQVAVFRKQQPTWKGDPDDLKDSLKWLVDDWKFPDIGHILGVPDPSWEHSSVFDDMERRIEEEYEDDDDKIEKLTDQLRDGYGGCCARTAARLMEATELKELRKTDDFEFRYAVEYDFNLGEKELDLAIGAIAEGEAPAMPENAGNGTPERRVRLPEWKITPS